MRPLGAALVTGLTTTCTLLLAGCSDTSGLPDLWPLGGGSGSDGPPPVRVSDQDSTLSLLPWTTCWSGGGQGFCSDGVPPDPLPSLGEASTHVTVSFPEDGWSFIATQATPGSGDDEGGHAQLERVDDHSWRLRPVGPPGVYEVELFGRGPQGDVAVSFAMVTAD